jgi:hypothetical protein
MDNISIKDHPPWYARGTPVINPRDGPPMASSEISLFAIRKGPSARGEPKDKTHRWLTLKNTYFNTRKSVYLRLFAMLGTELDRNIEQVIRRLTDNSSRAKCNVGNLHLLTAPDSYWDNW